MSQINGLLEASKKLSLELEKSMKGFEDIVSANLDQADTTEANKQALESAKRTTLSALQMARSGNVQGINELINSFKDGRKDSKA
jgi:hypothetical protein